MEATTMTQDELAKLLEWLRTTADQTKDFVGEQAPLIAKEMITWGITLHSIMLFLAISGLVLGMWWFKQGIAYEPKRDYDTPPFYFIGGTITTAFGCIFTPLALLHLLKIIVAPRLYVIDQLRGLL